MKGIFSFREHVSTAIKREFIEEAMNSNPEGEKHIEELFKTAVPVKNLLTILIRLNFS
jgi:hypothetical protein